LSKIEVVTVRGRKTPVCIDDEQAIVAAEVLKAIAHPLRLRVLCLLSQNEENVKSMAAELDVPSAIVSQQLRILRAAGLVAASTRDGHAYYRITEPHLFRMLSCVESCITDRGARGEL
jgi:ArsR family transcriptional regulator